MFFVYRHQTSRLTAIKPLNTIWRSIFIDLMLKEPRLVRRPVVRIGQEVYFGADSKTNAFFDKETLFPLPANHEQIKILDCIEHSNWILVQGPPNTGKSHIIANLICHFMTQGKRALVTSQKDRALDVLHSLIPDSLKPLCLSVLTFDSDNRKKLERAVNEGTNIFTNANLEHLFH